ncbi:odorant receptor 85b-like [Diaphorina citri]|uniref:Odorant receptor n=1 Tax=Diaphorina citri TaxID=121845 RepID=A0A1S3DHX7_DIACI|nr:odorant receptor 85b-like [Diaphorina citri]
MSQPSKVQKNQYMAFNILLLKTCFIWPLDCQNRLVLLIYRLMTWSTCFVLAFVSIGQLLKICVSLDLQELSSTVDVFTMTASALYKMVFLMYNMETLLRIVQVVHTQFEEYPIRGIHKFTMSSHIGPCSLYSSLYVLAGIISSFVWNFAPLFFSPMCPIIDPTAPLTIKNRKVMPINIWLPINIAESPAYEIIFALESYTFSMSTLLYLSIDAFFFYLIHVISGQLKLVDASFKSLFILDERLKHEHATRLRQMSKLPDAGSLTVSKSIRLEDSLRQYRHHVLNRNLNSIVKIHATVLELIRTVEILFSSTIGIDFLHAILSLSFALFQTQMTVAFIDTVKMYLFLVICIVHQFSNNFFGEMLIHFQHIIVNSIYESPWYTGDAAFKRSVRIITNRSLKPVKLEGFKMFILCLHTFVEVPSSVLWLAR